ncbi:MAG: LysR family transcriptional regulator [Coriobacteriales bacterium]|nr:LysR family transcriptional regulator [Coriobacteriales bacterium]
MRSMKHLGVQTRLTIYTGKTTNEATFGKGVATLLRGIAETGSLNAAAKGIKMAYSKAWRIVKETESGFGFLLIHRDGARGSTLSKEGQRLLDVYEALEQEAAQYVSVRFKELIS